ncbi:MAG TPA: CARDB domain-containing protein, partial [Methanoregulaceae archaeon]|nr:CARDB domain-containing protein [Methanoregulaceae archaeon]
IHIVGQTPAPTTVPTTSPTTIPTTVPTTVPTAVPTTISNAPDLVVQSVTLGTTSNPDAGQRISVNARVKNQGGGYALASKALIYLSHDMMITSGDTYLGSITVGVLPAGQSSSGTAWVTFHEGLGPGDYYIGVVADGSGTISESNENNNANSAIIHVDEPIPIYFGEEKVNKSKPFFL